MKTLITGSKGKAGTVLVRGAGVRSWQRWAPFAALAWSILYAALGIYWVVGGSGFL